MHMPELPVDTDRLHLRFFEIDDLDALETLAMHPEAQRYLDAPVRDGSELRGQLDTLRAMRRIVRPGDTLAFAVCSRPGGRAIGQVTLRWTDATASQAELRFLFAPICRESGVDAEAIRTVLDIAFETLGLHRVAVRTSARHQHTVSLLKRLGLRLEAHYREHALFQGEWDEELHFAVLDREWRHPSKVHEMPRHRVA